MKLSRFEFIRKYQQRKPKTIFGVIIKNIVLHNLTRFLFFSLLMMIGAVGMWTFFSEALIFPILFWIGMSYIIIILIVSMIYAWIINPIKDWKK